MKMCIHSGAENNHEYDHSFLVVKSYPCVYYGKQTELRLKTGISEYIAREQVGQSWITHTQWNGLFSLQAMHQRGADNASVSPRRGENSDFKDCF